MVDPRRDEQPEQLTGGEGTRPRWSVLAVVAVLVAAGVALGRTTHHPTHPAAAQHRTVQPAPAATTARRVHLGSVFLEHLAQCTRTDHRHHLTVALGVTNLGGDPLVLVGATGISSDSLLVQPVGVSVDTKTCTGASAQTPFELDPGADAVVTLAFRIGAVCPRHALVSARVSFDGGAAGVIHADSSLLANLDKVGFTQCGAAT